MPELFQEEGTCTKEEKSQILGSWMTQLYCHSEDNNHYSGLRNIEQK